MRIRRSSRQGALALLLLVLLLAWGFGPAAAQAETPTPGQNTPSIRLQTPTPVDNTPTPTQVTPTRTAQPSPTRQPTATPKAGTPLEDLRLPEDTLLPDLQTLPFSYVILGKDGETGERLLRFNNQIVNSGQGPLELRGQRMDTNADEFTVNQHFYGGEETIPVPLEGTFYYNRDHTHYHWQGFAAYEIWTVETGGGLARRVVANDKVSFCLFDTHIAGREWREENIEHELEIPPNRVYNDCVFNRQGISPGWVDLYRYKLAGQALNIDDLDDGVYALRSVVNPENILYEANTDNNDAVLYFSLQEDELILIGEEFSLVDYFNLLVDEGMVDVVEGKLEVKGKTRVGE